MRIANRRLGWAALVLALMLLSACGLFRSDRQESVTPSPASGTATSTATSTTASTPASGGAPATPATPEPLTLVLWTTEDYAPNSETDGGRLLLEQIQAFQQSHDVGIQVILKKRSGSGGLLDFLTTASKAAPSVLPDLITLSNADLYRAAQAGLIQPLDELVSPDLLDDPFDFARTLTRIDDHTFGVLYQADLTHVIFDTASVTEAPLTWQDVFSSTTPLVFAPYAPVDGVNTPLLIQYLALGGRLTDAEGNPRLDKEPLAQALTFFQQGRQSGVISAAVLDLTDETTAWADFRIGEAGLLFAPASLYLAERASLSNLGFGPMPLSPQASARSAGEAGSASVGRGWALALVTQDADRQQQAVALIEYLLAPENSGAWSQAAGRLPTRHAALDVWNPGDPYVPFARDLLSSAWAAPNPQLAAVMSGPLTDALIAVISGHMTPDEAAQSAVEAVEAAP